MEGHVSPDRIMDVGMGFFASKTLLSAVELGVFTELADGPLSLSELEDRLELDSRGSADFLDARVALGFLEREDGLYRNAPDADVYLDRNGEYYLGGILEMANDRLYPYWGNLTEALRTGEPQNEIAEHGDLFEAVYDDRERLEQFAGAMTSLSARPARTLATDFEWDRYETMCDLGASKGIVPVTVVAENDHLEATAFDLPDLEPVAEEFIASRGLDDRVSFHGGDFFEDDLPEHDVFVMGHILHDWGIEEKLTLLEKSYEALPEGGALVVYGSMIDPDRRENEMGLLMSLNMLVETPDGFDYTTAECREWMIDVGFAETERRDLPGPKSMVIARK